MTEVIVPDIKNIEFTGVNSNSRIISTDEDPSLRIESSAIINLRGVSTKLNKYYNPNINLNLNSYPNLIACDPIRILYKKLTLGQV